MHTHTIIYIYQSDWEDNKASNTQNITQNSESIPTRAHGQTFISILNKIPLRLRMQDASFSSATLSSSVHS